MILLITKILISVILFNLMRHRQYVLATTNQFIFEISGNEKFCFYNKFDAAEVKCFVEYKVIKGSHSEVDVRINSPSKQLIYNRTNAKFDSLHATFYPGAYSFCFKNSQTSLTTSNTKHIFFALRKLNEKVQKVKVVTKKKSAHSKFEETFLATLDRYHTLLNSMEDSQTTFRNAEAEDRDFSDYLNQAVLFCTSCMIGWCLIIGIGQVLLLKTCFAKTGSTGQVP